MKVSSDNIKRKEYINSILIVIYIFAMPLTLPLDIGYNLDISTKIVIITLFISILNDSTIYKSLLFTIIVFIIFFTINYIVVDYKELVLETFIKFIRWGIIPMYLASKVSNYKKVLEWWYYMGILNFIISQYTLQYSKMATDINYMNFGICMLYSFIIFTIYFYKFNKHKLINLTLVIISFIQILVFGNRGSLLCCTCLILYFELRLIFTCRKYAIKGILKNIIRIIILSIVIYILTFKLYGIIYNLKMILDSMDINSYGIYKILLGIEKGLAESSSGRDIIYMNAIEISKYNSYLPMGIGYYTHMTGKGYPHNIFLDILITFGLPGLILAIIGFTFILSKFIKYRNYDEYYNLIVVSMFIYSTTRLIMSSTIWLECMFWIPIVSVIYMKKRTI